MPCHVIQSTRHRFDNCWAPFDFRRELENSLKPSVFYSRLRTKPAGVRGDLISSSSTLPGSCRKGSENGASLGNGISSNSKVSSGFERSSLTRRRPEETPQSHSCSHVPFAFALDLKLSLLSISICLQIAREKDKLPYIDEVLVSQRPCEPRLLRYGV